MLPSSDFATDVRTVDDAAGSLLLKKREVVISSATFESCSCSKGSPSASPDDRVLRFDFFGVSCTADSGGGDSRMRPGLTMIARYQWKLRSARDIRHQLKRQTALAYFSLIGMKMYFFSKMLMFLVHFLTLSYGSNMVFLKKCGPNVSIPRI